MKHLTRILSILILALFAGQAQAALTLPGANDLITEGDAVALMAGTGYSTDADTSADGSRIVFGSYATNLTDDTDTNGGEDIFLYDANTDTFTLISKNVSGTDTADAVSSNPIISADGSTVIFRSSATDLTADAANGFNNLYIYDVATQTTTRIGPMSDAFIGLSGYALSADGDKVVFPSEKTTLTGDADNNGSADVFLYDKSDQTITLVSESVGGGATANGSSTPDSMSADGSLIVFGSSATDLVSITDTNGTSDLFLYEVATGDMTLITTNDDDNAAANDRSTEGVISADGSTIAFRSRASDLTVDTDSDTKYDIFLYDVGTGAMTLVTQNMSGTDSGNEDSDDPRLSTDGSRLVFRSEASDLTADAKNNSAFDDDIFLYEAGTITLISENVSGTGGGNESSNAPYISADGDIIAYYSGATDLTNDTDANGTSNDVFVYDVNADTTTLVTKNASGDASANQAASEFRLSSDGSAIIFETSATDIVSIVDLNGDNDIFRYEVATDTRSIITAAPFPAGSANSEVFNASMSADGTRIAFESRATNLTAEDDTNNTNDIFLYEGGTITLISKNEAGTAAGNGRSRQPTISADGSMVVFGSEASDLTAYTDTNQTIDVFVYDVDAGTLTLISLNEAGTSTGNDDSRRPIISDDGSTVVFESEASDLTADTDTNSLTDVFLYDVGSGNVTLVSKNDAGTSTANSTSDNATISGDGSTVAFRSRADDLTADNDTNGTNDIFLYDVGSEAITLVTQNMAGDNTGNDESSRPRLSFDGSVLAFRSEATDLSGEAQTTNRNDAFVYDVNTDTLTLASKDPAGTNGADDRVNTLDLSADGTLLAFDTSATNLATTDTNGSNDVFLYDITGDTLTLLSANPAGTDAANGSSSGPAISADNGTVVYHSSATDITADSNSFGEYNIYAYDVASGENTLITTNTAGTDAGNGNSFNPVPSSAGDVIVYHSSATNLTTDELSGGVGNLFLFGPLPAAPTSLSVVYDSATADVTLTWTDNATNETGYVAERSANGGLTWVAVTLGADTTTITDTSIRCGGAYSYRVVATYLSIESTPSNVASVDVVCLDNGGFETDLENDTVPDDWVFLNTAPLNGERQFCNSTYSYDGNCLFLITGDDLGIFGLRQTVEPLPGGAGSAGDIYHLTFWVRGSNVDASGAYVGARLSLKDRDTQTLEVQLCPVSERGTFGWASYTCSITATIAHDWVRADVGIRDVTSGFIAFDAVTITQD